MCIECADWWEAASQMNVVEGSFGRRGKGIDALVYKQALVYNAVYSFEQFCKMWASFWMICCEKSNEINLEYYDVV